MSFGDASENVVVVNDTTDPVNVNIVSGGSGGGTVDQGSPNTPANAWPYKLVDSAGVHVATIGATGALSVDGSAVTQPVSGPGGTAVTVSVNNYPITQSVSGPLTDTQLRAAPVPVSGTVGVTGVATAAAQTDKSQFTKITDGTDTLDVLPLGTGNNAAVIAPAETTVTYSGVTATTAGIDLSNFSTFWIYFHATANIQIQFSDNNTNWSAPVPIWDNASAGNLPVGGGNFSVVADRIVYGVVSAKWFRILYNSGTITCTVVASNKPFVAPGSTVNVSGNVTVPQGTPNSANAWFVTLAGATPTVTTPSLSTTSATLLAAGTAGDRKEVIIYNGSGVDLYVLYGAGTASTTNFTVKVTTGQTWVEDKYTGAMTAILASGTSTAVQVTKIGV